jgi:DNA repair exonuclease SbcCD ATPase subunit
MTRLDILAACVLTLGACASTPSDVDDWAAFVSEADRYSQTELQARIAAAHERYREAPDDLARLRLAYLLGLPVAATQDVDAGRALLVEVDPDGRYSSLRSLVTRQIALMARLQSARQELHERDSEIGSLRNRIGELEAQNDRPPPDNGEAELQALRARVRELQAQLDALKSIETEMTEGQKAIDDIPDE